MTTLIPTRFPTLDEVERGEVIVLCRGGVPVAELRAVPPTRRDPRPVGVRDDFEIPDSFFEPLPDLSPSAAGSPRS